MIWKIPRLFCFHLNFFRGTEMAETLCLFVLDLFFLFLFDNLLIILKPLSV